jgi:hypothetical protein
MSYALISSSGEAVQIGDFTGTGSVELTPVNNGDYCVVVHTKDAPSSMLLNEMGWNYIYAGGGDLVLEIPVFYYAQNQVWVNLSAFDSTGAFVELGTAENASASYELLPVSGIPMFYGNLEHSTSIFSGQNFTDMVFAKTGEDANAPMISLFKTLPGEYYLSVNRKVGEKTYSATAPVIITNGSSQSIALQLTASDSVDTFSVSGILPALPTAMADKDVGITITLNYIDAQNSRKPVGTTYLGGTYASFSSEGARSFNVSGIPNEKRYDIDVVIQDLSSGTSMRTLNPDAAYKGGAGDSTVPAGVLTSTTGANALPASGYWGEWQ